MESRWWNTGGGGTLMQTIWPVCRSRHCTAVLNAAAPARSEAQIGVPSQRVNLGGGEEKEQEGEQGSSSRRSRRRRSRSSSRSSSSSSKSKSSMDANVPGRRMPVALLLQQCGPGQPFAGRALAG